MGALCAVVTQVSNKARWTGLVLALVFIAGAARAVDPECAHMLTAPNPAGTVFSIAEGNLAICTPALSALGNSMLEEAVIESCTASFGEASRYTAEGPFDGASVVVMPIPAALEFDQPMSIWCTAEGKEGASLSAVARFPFSGPGTPGLPR